MSSVLAQHSGHDGISLVDAHTPAHFGTGLIAGIVGVDAYTAMMVFVGAKILAEAVQGDVKRALFGRDHAESLGNELMDLAVEMLGHHIGHYLHERKLAEQAAAAALVPVSGFGAYYIDPVYVPIR